VGGSRKTSIRASERDEIVTTSVQTRNIYEPLLTPSHLLRSAQIRLSMVEKESEIVAMKKTLQDGKGERVSLLEDEHTKLN